MRQSVSCKISTVVHSRGRGGQNWSKFDPRSYWMNPNGRQKTKPIKFAFKHSGKFCVFSSKDKPAAYYQCSKYGKLRRVSMWHHQLLWAEFLIGKFPRPQKKFVLVNSWYFLRQDISSQFWINSWQWIFLEICKR